MRDAGVDVALLLGVNAGGGAGGDPAMGSGGREGLSTGAQHQNLPRLFFSRENEGEGCAGGGR